MNALSMRRRLIVALHTGSVMMLSMSTCGGAPPDKAALIKAAISGEGQARYTAIDDLGEHHTDAAGVVPELQKLLADKDAQVRWRSARALGDYGAQAMGAAPVLRNMLNDSDPIAQYHAAVSLGRIGDKSDETIHALIVSATSNDKRIARAAIAALRALELDRDHVMQILGEVLKSDDHAVVVHAMEAIVERGAAGAPTLIAALKNPQTAYLACTAIEHMGPDAAATVPELTKLLTATKHSKLLIQALLALASIGPAAEAASPTIVPMLQWKDDATVPVAAAYALGSIGAKNADAPLRAAMENGNPFLQMIAAWSVAKLHPDDQSALKTAVAMLVQGFKNNDPAIRTAAAKALQKLQAPPEIVAPELVQLLSDKDPEVEAHAVDAIASLGESVVPRVIIGLQRPELREPAVRVLRKLGPKAAGAVAALVNASEGADAKFRTEIQLALGAIGPAAAPATEMLAKSLESSDAGERESALYALRQIGRKAGAAVRPLLQKMKADESFDSNAAAWALARIAPNSPNVSVVVVRKLSRGLSDVDETVRLESAAALGEMGPAAKAAAAALEKAAKDDSSAAVRSTAAESLEHIRS
jgi:HEAT repeat protein